MLEYDHFMLEKISDNNVFVCFYFRVSADFRAVPEILSSFLYFDLF